MKNIDTVLFDLDGSLLPMAQDEFVRLYMEALGRTFAPDGFEPGKLTGSVWRGVEAMIKNDGSMSNRERFWQVFSETMGQDMEEQELRFVSFYENQFGEAKAATGYSELSAKAVRLLKKKGYTVVLATNPVFPTVATYRRMRWAGLSPEDFDLVTSNILADVLIPLSPVVARFMKKGGIYITSGILDQKEAEVRQAVEGAGMEIIERDAQGEWVSLAARKK